MTKEEFERLTPEEQERRIDELARISRLLQTMKNPRLSMRARLRAQVELNTQTNAPTIIAEIVNAREKE